MIKRTDSTSNWRIYDNSAMGTGVELYANTSAARWFLLQVTINFNSTGFEITTTGGWLNANGRNLFIYGNSLKLKQKYEITTETA